MDRPTFSEHWHRVEGLRPRLRAGVRTHRQRFAGRVWWVLEDPASGRFSRVDRAGYGFVGLLDGTRSVEEAWSAAAARFGDASPTQPEAVRLLANLYRSNLLASELPEDAEALLRRRSARVRKEAGQRAAGFLFVRLPLVDPDPVMEALRPVGRAVFSWVGFGVWLTVVLGGAWVLWDRWPRFASEVGAALSPGNLPLLFGVIVGVKLLHELGHGLALKTLAGREGSGAGEVRTLGVMLLVLVPLPYVDASAAWALRSKWSRALVGAAGMYVEVFAAAVAALVWARAGVVGGEGGGPAGAVAHNVVLVAGVTTLLFNANPLLRYDGYYIASDLLELPNLATRAREELHHVVKRWVFGLRSSVGPTDRPGEAAALVVYAAASGVYRVAVVAAIVWFVSGRWYVVGVAAAAAAAATMLVWPVLRFVGWLATGEELESVRGRAVCATVGLTAAVFGGLGLVPVRDSVTLVGVADAAVEARVTAGESGFVEWIAPAGERVAAGTAAALLENAELRSESARARASAAGAEARRLAALGAGPAEAAVAREEAAAREERARLLEELVDALVVRAPVDGVWSPAEGPLGGATTGRWVERGGELGRVVEPGVFEVRAVVGQVEAPLVIAASEGAFDAGRVVRVRGWGGSSVGGNARGGGGAAMGVLEEVEPAGTRRLPAESLRELVSARPGDGGGAGGDRVFVARVLVRSDGLVPGRRVVVRVGVGERPIAARVWRWLRGLVR